MFVAIKIVLCVFLAGYCACSAGAWDCFYDGSVLPNDSSLGTNAWTASGDLSMCSTDGSVLHIVDTNPSASIGFGRPTPPANSPLTVEARVRVVSGNSTVLYAGTPSYTCEFYLYPDHLAFHEIAGYEQNSSYWTDLTSFRTIRIATSDQGVSYIWLDGSLIAQGRTISRGNYFYPNFGSPWGGGTGESYWDYVACSNAFVRVPEPSSLLALLAGLVGCGAAVLRRRH